LLEPPPPPQLAAVPGSEEQRPGGEGEPAVAAAAAAAGCYLLTGGADSSIKCWRLADWLPGLDAGAAPRSGLPAGSAADCFMLQGVPPPPAVAALGCGATYGGAGQQPTPVSCPDRRQQQQEAQGPQQESELQERQLGVGTWAGSERRAQAGAAAPRDSRGEWVRCLAMAAADCGGGDGRGRRRRLLWLGTNRGLLHRVTLPGAPLGPPQAGQPVPTQSLQC
jgi:hypothetical protein